MSQEVYLPALRDSGLYIGLFGNEYSEGTVEEFEKAGEWRIERHLYIKDFGSSIRHSRLTDFISQNNHLAMVEFKDLRQLHEKISENVEHWIANQLQKVAQRKRRYYELTGIREQLKIARRDYEDYLRDYPRSIPPNRPWHETIINRAVEACEDAQDKGNEPCRKCLGILAGQTGFDECSHQCEKTLAYIARLRLTKHLVDENHPGDQQKAEVQRWGWYGNRNRNALHDAIDRIYDLIAELE